MAAWWSILSNGATIVEVARQIYNTINKDKSSSPPPTNDLKDFWMRLDYLEKNEIRQAELVKRMAEQMNEMSSKIRTANTIAIVSIIIAIISVVWQLLDK